ncbi:MAG: zinc ribbon domain-containing protein [Halioglobus sp.]|nr:zinc ribbon domain-containing protein [Halioglobus sp.]
MPIYEYQCEACHEQLEALQKISDAPLLDCPHCGKPALKKKVSAAAFRLKGSGWYETDFKTGNKKNLVGGSEGAGGSSSAPASGAGKSSESTSGSSKSGDSTKTA